jgi:lipoprotein signal peptidase
MIKEFIAKYMDKATDYRVKAFVLLCFVFVFTGSDLLVKEIAARRLKDKPNVVVIPGFWEHHYVQNDDIGFSALRGLNKIFSIPQKIGKDKFDKKVLGRLSNSYHQALIKKFYQLSEGDTFYRMSPNLSKYDKEVALHILSSVGYRTVKWFFLVLLQGSGSIFVIVFFFSSKKWRYLFPLALIASGALGNVTDRIIRGYVVDYVKWTFSFIPHPLFNPWPIFNLADVFTISGAVLLFIILFFFPDEDEKKSRSPLKNPVDSE